MRVDCGRCVIRSYRHDDADALVAQANNPNVARYMLSGFPSPYTLADARSWLSRVMDIDIEETHFALQYERQLAGGIGYMPLRDESRYAALIGYWVGEEFWGKGIATAALRGLVEWLWKNTEFERLQAYVFEPNRASARVLAKCGFVHEATHRKFYFKHGRFFDALIYCKLRER